MPRFYFHLKSPTQPVLDTTGVELAGLTAAHWHAMRLVYRLREHAAESGEDWVIEVAEESGAAPLVVAAELGADVVPADHALGAWGGPSQIREEIRVRGMAVRALSSASPSLFPAG